MTSRPSPRAVRDLLITCNGASGLPREAVCRLAAVAEPLLAPGAQAARIARELALPESYVARALGLRSEAGRTAAKELRRAEKLQSRIVTWADPEYPPALRQLSLPPPVLYIRGELPAGPGLAIVGARRADPYGLETARFFARALAETGLAIVSGFAHGVDAAAHRAALEAPAGRTVAILGCGLGVDYPSGHGKLGEEIAARGALVTEFPCHRLPTPWHFPVRNRIIAALSHGTLVIQATLRSGSLITARLALDLGREVYAVPGRIFDERSLGPNGLLRDGAVLAQHPQDIVDNLPDTIRRELRLTTATAADPATPSAPGLAGRLLALLSPGDLRSPEEIADLAQARVDLVLGALLELEITGLVRRHPGPAYCRCA